MRNVKCISCALAVLMTIPMLSACALGKSGEKVVKKDDPWFESVRFELETEKLNTESVDSSVVGYSNGKVFHVYVLTNFADYDNYRRTLIDTYDEEGNFLSRMQLEEPANYSITKLRSVMPDAEGKEAEAIAELFTKGSFDYAVVTIDLVKGEVKDPRFFKDADGNTLQILTGPQTWAGVSEVYKAGDYYVPIIYDLSGTEGNTVHAYAYRGSEYLSELDFEGLADVYNIEEFSLDPRSNTLITVGYTRSDGALVLEFEAETGKRVSSEKYTVQSDDVNLSDYRTMATGDLCKIDTLGNITAFDIKSLEIKTVVDNNWYTPYFADLSQEVELIACDEDKAVICSRKDTEYSMFISGQDETVTILKRSETNPHAGKKVIELATPIDRAMTDYLSNAIYEFNKSDNEYLIRVWSKYKEGIKAGREFAMLDADDEKLYTMIQELKGSEAPDLAIGIQKNYAMRDDVLEDLTGYLDQSVTDMQFENIIDASKIGNKQYFLPVTIEIEGLVIDTSLIGSGDCGITFEDYDKLIANDLDGFSPYDYPMSTYNNRKDFVLSCIDTKGAIEGDDVDFGTDQFYGALEYSKKNLIRDGFTEPEETIWADEVKKPRTACRYDKIDSYAKFIHACKSSEGSYTIIGTPTVDASGPRFRAIETVSVTASSGVKEGCRRFINFLFAGAGFNGSSREFQNLVTNREIMARNISIITEKNNKGVQADEELKDYMIGLDEYSIVYGYKEADKDMEEQMMKSISSVSVYYYDDPVITAFLVEDIAPYYVGDRSPDDVVRILNDRANKYIKEM